MRVWNFAKHIKGWLLERGLGRKEDSGASKNGETYVIHLKDNHLPKGLTYLEDLFDSNDIPKKPKMQPLKADIEEYNLGTEDNPKMIKLSKSLPPD